MGGTLRGLGELGYSTPIEWPALLGSPGTPRARRLHGGAGWLPGQALCWGPSVGHTGVRAGGDPRPTVPARRLERRRGLGPEGTQDSGHQRAGREVPGWGRAGVTEPQLSAVVALRPACARSRSWSWSSGRGRRRPAGLRAPGSGASTSRRRPGPRRGPRWPRCAPPAPASPPPCGRAAGARAPPPSSCP